MTLMVTLKRGPWTKEELKTLKRDYPYDSTAWVADELGRPPEAVKKKASRLGLKKSRRYRRTVLGRKD